MSVRSATARLLLGAVLATALPSASAGAQSPTAQASWRVMRDPFADLWFHTMALVGDEGFGPLELYDTAYARRARMRRTAANAAAGDRTLAELRARIVGDSALELLHFVPMYLVGTPPPDALAALRDAATGANRTARDRAHAAARAIVGALPRGTQRRALLSVVSVAEDEWRDVLAPAGGLVAGATPVAVAPLDEAWQSRFAPLLDRYLRRSGQARGVIVVSPAVGADGRVAGALPWGTVVAVGVRAGEADAPLLAAVRELAYRGLDAVHAPPVASGRVAAARARDELAVRAGAVLLSGDPPLAAHYRELYRAASRTPARSFEQLYPIDSATERALRDALGPGSVLRR